MPKPDEFMPLYAKFEDDDKIVVILEMAGGKECFKNLDVCIQT